MSEYPSADQRSRLGCDDRIEELERKVEHLRQELAESQRSEQRLRLITDALPVLIADVDTEQCYRFNNAAYGKWFGTTPGQLFGRTVRDVLGDGVYAAIAVYVRRALAGERVRFNTVVPDSDGTPRDVEALYIPHRDESGQVRGFYALVLDVSELSSHKRTEAALVASKARYRQQAEELEVIYRSAPIGRAVLDTQLRYLRVNEHLAAINGLPAAAHLGKTVREVVPALADRAEAIARRVIATGEPVMNSELSGETVAQPGVTRYWTDHWLPLKDEAGQVWGLNVVVEETTDRRRAEQAAIEQFRLTEAVFAHSLSGLAVLDVNYDFLRVNEAYARGNHRAVSEFSGRNHFEMYPSNDKLIFDEVVRTKQPFSTFNRPFVFPDQPERGETYWDWKLVPVLDGKGEVECLVLSLFEVTERARAEEALRTSEARFRRQAAELEQIYRTAPAGLCVLDTQLRYVHVNERLAEANGVPPEAHLGKTVREVLPGVAAQVEPLLRRVLETGEPVLEFETSAEAPTQPGVPRTWVSQYWPLKDDEGNVFGINAVVEETTERKRLEETRESERAFRTLAENSTDIVARFDRSLRRVYVNPVIEPLLGRPRAEIIGKTHREMGLPEDVANALSRPLAEVFATGEPQTMEATLPTAQGARYFDARLVPELGPAGQVETVLSISRDITDRKLAEDALRESESKYRTLVENLYEGIWLIDEDANTTFVNARMAELLGHRVEDMVGASLFSFMDRKAMEAAKQNLARGRRGVRAQYDFEFFRKDGSPIHTHIVTTPLFDEAGRYRGALAGVTDITARKQAEAALRRANDELQQFASMASHDLRAPLRAVSSLSTALEDDLGPKLTGESRQHLQLLRERVRLMDALIDGLLTYSSAGGQTLSVESVDSGQLVRDVLKTLDLPKGLNVSIAEEMPLLVTDRTKLQQVFANLLGNAIKYHDRADGHVWVSSRDAGVNYAFSVADDGPGIPPEYHQRVFQMLQRGPAARTREGTGMGLAVVKKLVENVGGRISLESTPGQGTAFHFTWPKVMEPETTEPP